VVVAEDLNFTAAARRLYVSQQALSRIGADSLDSDIRASCMLAAVSDLLSIGRFGKEAQLTPRQPRYYHALGLLVPAAVDPRCFP
jgi:hypothetical protein